MKSERKHGDRDYFPFPLKWNENRFGCEVNVDSEEPEQPMHLCIQNQVCEYVFNTVELESGKEQQMIWWDCVDDEEDLRVMTWCLNTLFLLTRHIS